jgi:hypothetical protein
MTIPVPVITTETISTFENPDITITSPEETFTITHSTMTFTVSMQ